MNQPFPAGVHPARVELGSNQTSRRPMEVYYTFFAVALVDVLFGITAISCFYRASLLQ